MNDLKPAARYLSPIAIAIAILIFILQFTRPSGYINYEFVAIMLALLAIWLQGITKN